MRQRLKEHAWWLSRVSIEIDYKIGKIYGENALKCSFFILNIKVQKKNNST